MFTEMYDNVAETSHITDYIIYITVNKLFSFNILSFFPYYTVPGTNDLVKKNTLDLSLPNTQRLGYLSSDS